jgi:hypothetical protein
MNFDTYNTKFAEKSRVTERGDLLQYFTDRLNETRGEGTSFKKLTIRLVAVKLAHLKVGDLYYLKSTCDNAKSFGSCFWWSIKAK